MVRRHRRAAPITVGDVWTYRYKDIHYSKQRITEFVPGKRVAWHVFDGRLDFTEDKTEWTGTDIAFDITDKDGQDGGPLQSRRPDSQSSSVSTFARMHGASTSRKACAS